MAPLDAKNGCKKKRLPFATAGEEKALNDVGFASAF
tara:strand:- start:418 stop:525 length:108 start_codon:yes stop_codon:yes gene_type:complete